jgi:hypothetical protein
MLAGYRIGVYLPPGTFGQNVATTIGQDPVAGAAHEDLRDGIGSDL